MLKKIIFALLISIIFLICCTNFSFAQETENYIWLEAEQGTVVSGQYHIVENPSASGGMGYYLDTTYSATKQDVSQVNFSFTVEKEGEYDIKILGTPGNASWLSQYKWKVDGGQYQYCTSVAETPALYQQNQYGIPVSWYTLSKMELSVGVHTLSILTDEMRSYNDFMYHYFDAVAIVPSAWNWVPNGIEKPTPPELIWIEARDNAISNGIINESNVQASAGGLQYVLGKAPEDTVYSFDYSFEPKKSGIYDVYILASPANETWLEPWKYKIDGQDKGYLKENADYQNYGGGYSSNLGIGMRWQKADKLTLTAQPHTVSFVCDTPRRFNQMGDYVAAVDAVVIVPQNEEIDLSGKNAASGKAEILAKCLKLGTDPARVTNDLILQSNTDFGATVSWSSSDTLVVDNSGKIIYNRTENKRLTLTATVSINGYTAQKKFDITVLATQAPVDVKKSYITLQSQNAQSISGYTIVQQANSFANQVLYCNTSQTSVFQADFTFDIEESANYDIWILSSEGNSKWTSKYKWALDNGTFANNLSAITELYKAADNRPVGWSKLTTGQLLQGTHGIHIKTDTKREANLGDKYYHIFDTIIIVKTSNQWHPSGYIKPSDYKVIPSNNAEYYNGYTQNSTTRTTMVSDSNASTVPTLEYTIAVEESAEYDIYVLGNSAFSWSIDNEVYSLSENCGRVVYTDIAEMKWYRLTTSNLQKGFHTLYFHANGQHVIDSILVVRASVAYEPYSLELFGDGISKSYVQINYSNIAASTAMQTMTVQNSMAANISYINEVVAKANIKYSCFIPSTQSYDLWILANKSNEAYLSQYEYRVDEEEYKLHSDGYLQMIWSHNLGYTTGWSKLGTQSIKKGNSTIDIHFLDREFDGKKVGCVDTILLVPSAWGWTPSLTALPYDTREVSLTYTSGSISNNSIEKNSTLQVQFGTMLNQITDADIVFDIELSWKDEVVLSTKKKPSVLLKNRTVHTEYIDSVEFVIPPYAPNGLYEIKVGIVGDNFANTITYQTVGSPLMGNAAGAEHKSGQVLAMSLQNGVLSVHTTVNRSAETGAYLSFWKDNLLWGVLELGTVSVTQDNTLSFEHFAIPPMPAGEYVVKFGLHQFDVSGVETTVVIEADNRIKPLSYGYFDNSKDGFMHFWYINQVGAMIWDGKPFVPMGGMYCPNFITYYDANNVEANIARWNEEQTILQTLEEKGIYDLYINANSDGDHSLVAWQYLIDYLDLHGFRYGIQLNGSKANTHEGYFIAANVNAITATVEPSMTFATAAISKEQIGSPTELQAEYIIMNDTGVISSGMAMTECSDTQCRFSANVPASAKRQTVYFLPKVKLSSAPMPNIFEFKADTENRINSFFSRIDVGEGVRFVVDPTKNETNMANQFEAFRPYSLMYNTEFEGWLSAKYETVEALNNAWEITPQVATFREAARLLPMYTRGTYTWLINGANYTIYSYNNQLGCLWDDCVAYRDESLKNYNNHMADIIKQSVNIPVIYKNVAYHNNFFINHNPKGGFDGAGAEAYGNYERVATIVGLNKSMNNQYTRTAWNIVTETNIEEDMAKKLSSGIVSYPDKVTMYVQFHSLFNSGAKGIYDFLFYNTDAYCKAYSYVEKPILFDWLKEYRSSLDVDLIAKNQSQEKLFSLYPASGAWWNWNGNETIHNKRTAVLLGEDMTSLPNKILANGAIFTSTNEPTTAERIVVCFENAPATIVYGKKINDTISELVQNKQIIIMGLRKDLGSLPNIDRYYTSQTRTLSASDVAGDIYGNKAGDVVQILTPPSGANILMQTADGGVWAFRYGNLWVFANENWDNTSIRYLDDFDFIPEQVSLGRVLFQQGEAYFAVPQQGQNTIIFKLNNYSKEEKTVIVIVSIDNKQFILKEAILPPNTKDILITEEMIFSESKAEKVNYFLWNGLINMKALAPKQ